MNRNTDALKKLALIGAILAYAGAVIYGDIMFLQTIEIAFPKSGIFASLAIAGALVTALSALVLPMAMHWWFAPGLQFIGPDEHVPDKSNVPDADVPDKSNLPDDHPPLLGDDVGAGLAPAPQILGGCHHDGGKNSVDDCYQRRQMPWVYRYLPI